MTSTGADLIERWASRGHGHRFARECPACGDDLAAVGIIHLAYVHETCDCGTTEHDHLVERLWHLTCLVDKGYPVIERTLLRDAMRALQPGVRSSTRQRVIDRIKVFLAAGLTP